VVGYRRLAIPLPLFTNHVLIVLGQDPPATLSRKRLRAEDQVCIKSSFLCYISCLQTRPRVGLFKNG
jgi:hypothetical protein